MNSRRKPIAAAIVLGALLVAAEPSAATPLPGKLGTFSISPARRIVVGTPPAQLSDTAVTNTTDSPFSVTVFPAIVTQTIDGGFTFANTSRNLNQSRLAFGVSPTNFALAPQEQHTVSLSWNLLPNNQPWMAMGVIFQGIPRQQARTVHVVDRLLSVNFLRLPGNYKIDGSFTNLTASQYAPRVIQFLPFVKNIGQIFATPSAPIFTIQDSQGQVVYSAPWSPTIILPGATVKFPILLRKILPAGHYVATVSMNFGGPRRRSLPFTLVGPNQLPSPTITVRGFSASGTIGSPTQVVAHVISSGTAPANVKFHLFLGTAGEQPGQPALATGTVAYRNLIPGSTTDLSQPLGGPLTKGSYRVTMTWVDSTGLPHSLEASFTAVAAKSFLQKIWDWIKDHWWLFLILAALVVVGYVYHRERQRQRQMEAELAAARAEIEARRRIPHEQPAAVPAAGLGPEELVDEPEEPDPEPNPSSEPEPRSEWQPASNPPDPNPSNPHAPLNAGAAAAPSPPPVPPAHPGPQAGGATVIVPPPPAEPAVRAALPPPTPRPAAPAGQRSPAPPPRGAPAEPSTRRRNLTAAALLTVGVAGAVAVIRWRNRR